MKPALKPVLKKRIVPLPPASEIETERDSNAPELSGSASRLASIGISRVLPRSSQSVTKLLTRQKDFKVVNVGDIKPLLTRPNQTISPPKGVLPSISQDNKRYVENQRLLSDLIFKKIPESEIGSIQFGLLSDLEIEEKLKVGAFFEIDRLVTKANTKIEIDCDHLGSMTQIGKSNLNLTNTIYDPRLGSSIHTDVCTTCLRNEDAGCTGHQIGVIPLNTTIIIPGKEVYKYVIWVLQSLCYNCKGQKGLLLSNTKLENWGILPRKDYDSEGNLIAIEGYNGSERLRAIAERSIDNMCLKTYPTLDGESVITCGLVRQPIYKEDKETTARKSFKDQQKPASKIVLRYQNDDEKQNLSEEKAAEEFANLSSEVIQTLGFPFNNPPRNLFMSYILVVPPCNRKPKFQSNGNDPFDKEYCEIIKMANSIKQQKKEIEDAKFTARDYNGKSELVNGLEAKLRETIVLLKNRIARIHDDSGKKSKGSGLYKDNMFQSFKQTFSGKQGFIRANIISKRANYTSRTVTGIYTSPILFAVEVSKYILFKPGKEMTVPVEVTADNINAIKTLIAADEVLYFSRPNNLIAKRMRVNDRNKNEISPGYTIYRKIQNGDWIGLNRAPTLHKYNTIGVQIFIATDESLGIKVPLEIMINFAGDYDGDELSLYFPQTTAALRDLQTIMNAKNCLFSPANNKALIGLVFNSIQGAYDMTLKNTRIDPGTFDFLVKKLAQSRQVPENEFSKRIAYLMKAIQNYIDTIKNFIADEMLNKGESFKDNIRNIQNLIFEYLDDIKIKYKNKIALINQYGDQIQKYLLDIENINTIDDCNNIFFAIADIMSNVKLIIIEETALEQTQMLIHVETVKFNYIRKKVAYGLFNDKKQPIDVETERVTVIEQLRNLNFRIKSKNIDLTRITDKAVRKDYVDNDEDDVNATKLLNEIDELNLERLKIESDYARLIREEIVPDFYTGRFMFSLLLPTDFNYVLKDSRTDTSVIIEDGVFLDNSKQLTKTHVGSGYYCISEVIRHRYGNQSQMQFLQDCYWVLQNYVDKSPFSLSKHCVAPTDSILEPVKKRIFEEMNDKIEKVEHSNISLQEKESKIQSLTQNAVEQNSRLQREIIDLAERLRSKRKELWLSAYEEPPKEYPKTVYDKENIAYLEKLRKYDLYISTLKIDEIKQLDEAQALIESRGDDFNYDFKTSFMKYIESEARGSKKNSDELTIGFSNYVDNERLKQTLPSKFGARSNIYFSSLDKTAESRGFSSRSYMQGLSLSAFVAQAASGRVGSVDVSSRLPTVGDIRRKATHALQNLTVDKYGALREESTGKLYSISYGDDGLTGQHLVIADNLVTFFNGKKIATDLNNKYGQYGIEQPKDRNTQSDINNVEEEMPEMDIDMEGF